MLWLCFWAFLPCRMEVEEDPRVSFIIIILLSIFFFHISIVKPENHGRGRYNVWTCQKWDKSGWRNSSPSENWHIQGNFCSTSVVPLSTAIFIADLLPSHSYLVSSFTRHFWAEEDERDAGKLNTRNNAKWNNNSMRERKNSPMRSNQGADSKIEQNSTKRSLVSKPTPLLLHTLINT